MKERDLRGQAGRVIKIFQALLDLDLKLRVVAEGLGSALSGTHLEGGELDQVIETFEVYLKRGVPKQDIITGFGSALSGTDLRGQEGRVVNIFENLLGQKASEYDLVTGLEKVFSKTQIMNPQAIIDFVAKLSCSLTNKIDTLKNIFKGSYKSLLLRTVNQWIDQNEIPRKKAAVEVTGDSKEDLRSRVVALAESLQGQTRLELGRLLEFVQNEKIDLEQREDLLIKAADHSAVGGVYTPIGNLLAEFSEFLTYEQRVVLNVYLFDLVQLNLDASLDDILPVVYDLFPNEFLDFSGDYVNYLSDEEAMALFREVKDSEFETVDAYSFEELVTARVQYIDEASLGQAEEGFAKADVVSYRAARFSQKAPSVARRIAMRR